MGVQVIASRRPPLIPSAFAAAGLGGLLAFFALVLGLSGCSGKKINEMRALRAASWSGELLIEDRVKNSSRSASIDIVAQRDRAVRMDVSAIFGIYVGTLTLKNQDLRILLARERKFYRGSVNSAQSLRSVIGMNLHPAVLYTLLFDSDPGEGWRCSRSSTGLLGKCESSEGQLKIVWQKREAADSRAPKTILITSPKVEVQMQLGEAREDVSMTDKTFEIAPPSGYRTIQIE